MKNFINDDFLLQNETARTLYHNYAKKLPVIDYHCHIDPSEIANDRRFDNITQLWLGGDHYKWRLMRAAGVSEEYVTGNASDHDKFIKWAGVLEKAIGNPLYHWSHLELKRYFDYDGILNSKTVEKVWELCNEKLASPEMSARGIIKNSNVEVVCTTDDPIDTLEWHKKIKEDKSFNVKVLPAWRPDKATDIEKDEFLPYIDALTKASGIAINSFSDLCEAIRNRMCFFADNGCNISDHGIEYIYCNHADITEIEQIFAKRKNHQALSTEEIYKYKTAFLAFSAAEYRKMGWIMQLHYGCGRNNNTVMFNKLGANTGYDCINNHTPSAETAAFLDMIESTSGLPKTILYSLNPHDNQVIDTIAACFQDGSAVNKIQHGSAWWFNDNKDGMLEQLRSLANNGYLAGFVGMLTDSRSFVSYIRHEYFRRILCQLISEWVEAGEFPNDIDTLGEIVSGISYYNAKEYFKF